MRSLRVGAPFSFFVAGAFAVLLAGACSSTTANDARNADAGRTLDGSGDGRGDAVASDAEADGSPGSLDAPSALAEGGGDAESGADAPSGDAASVPDAGPYLSTLTNFVVVADAGLQATRFDTSGNAVDAHDGQIALFDGVYYLYGTSYACGYFLQTATAPFCGFKAYRSTDLVHWTDSGFLFDGTTALWQSRCNGATYGCYRPHVLYNASTKSYVLWINTYDTDNPTGYRVFTSASPAGPFVEGALPQLASTGTAGGFPNNGDMGLFADDDGTAYIVYTNWRANGAIAIEQLDPTYLTGTGAQATGLTSGNTEAPSLFKQGSTYYVTYSDPNCGYCDGTGTSYVTATSPLGTWSAKTTISPKSCGGQPSFVSPLTLDATTTYLYGSDLWTGSGNEATANYFWVPLTFSTPGAIDALPCPPTVTVPTVAPGSQAPAPAGEDNSSGVDGFQTYCDIAGATERAQAFTATKSGTLSRVAFTSFQSGYPSAGLEIDLYAADGASLLPTGPALSTALVPTASITWAPDEVAVAPNIAVVSGAPYAIVVSSATTAGCYGIEYRDATQAAGQAEAYSSTTGASFATEVGRTLKFETVVQ